VLVSANLGKGRGQRRGNRSPVAAGKGALLRGNKKEKTQKETKKVRGKHHSRGWELSGTGEAGEESSPEIRWCKGEPKENKGKLSTLLVEGGQENHVSITTGHAVPSLRNPTSRCEKPGKEITKTIGTEDKKESAKSDP